MVQKSDVIKTDFHLYLSYLGRLSKVYFVYFSDISQVELKKQEKGPFEELGISFSQLHISGVIVLMIALDTYDYKGPLGKQRKGEIPHP